MNAQRVWDANVEGVVHVTSPTIVDVTAEEYKSIPVFQYEGWSVGTRRQLRGAPHPLSRVRIHVRGLRPYDPRINALGQTGTEAGRP